MKALRVASDLTLPLDVVTQTIGVLAKRRAGKSYLLAKLVEELWAAEQQVVVLDPKGDWWGLRTSADGKGAGVPILILGGEHKDVKLEVGAGEVVARMIVEERVSALLDLSEFRKHEAATFNADFLETLYRLKAREEYRTRMMLVIDEADAVAPQNPKNQGVRGGNVERMLGAAEDIVRRGGQRGIGCAMATQRAAVLNKNLLTQVQILVLLRLIAPQDLEAMNAWIDVHGTEAERKALMASLPSLPTGTAWFWSPGWPTETGIFTRAVVGKRWTFDSGATPTEDRARVAPKAVAEVDLGAVRKRMAATIERAKAEDPRELRRRIAALEADLRAAKTSAPPPERVEVPVLKEGQVKALEDLVGQLRKAVTGAEAAAAVVDAQAREITEAIAASRRAVSSTRGATRATQATTIRPALAPRRSPAGNGSGRGEKLPRGESAILRAIAQHDGGASREQLTVLTGYRRSSRDTYLQRLRERGLVDVAGDRIVATDAGVAALGDDFEPLPLGPDLLEHWRQRLPVGERACLEVAVAAYPKPIARDAISEATGYQRSSRDTYLQRLRSRRLVVEAGRGEIRAAEELFTP